MLGDLHGYWLQRPGYWLPTPVLRQILYDLVYVRATWQADKTGRDAAALDHRAAWERGLVLGLGQHLGPHWYPRIVEFSDPDNAATDAGARDAPDRPA